MMLYAVLAVVVAFLLAILWRKSSETVGELSCIDKNVQFSVYRTRTIVPERWYPMLVFAHLSERRVGQDGPDPLEEVTRQAGQVLGELSREFQRLAQDSAGAVPRAGELTFVPAVQGIEFNPTRRTFKWAEDVHREEFRLRATMAKDGETVRGSIAVFLGSILLAEVPLAIHVDSSCDTRVDASLLEPSRAFPYRRIFASYSRKDVAIVDQFEEYARAIGDRYLRDLVDLRSGEVWNERLARMIEDADVFQLFWSSNSMYSTFVKQEWQHALSLNRAGFVRPIYWEVPLPESPQEALPPDELRRLHFQYIVAAQSMRVESGSGVFGAGKHSTRSRVGLAAAIMIPMLVPIATLLLPDEFSLYQLGPTYRPTAFDNMLRILKIISLATSAYCLVTMCSVWVARAISKKLWAVLLRRGRKFWFLATLAFSLLLILLQASRLALELGMSRHAVGMLVIVFPVWLSDFFSVWLAYAWIRWVFLPYLFKAGDRAACTVK